MCVSVVIIEKDGVIRLVMCIVVLVILIIGFCVSLCVVDKLGLLK